MPPTFCQYADGPCDQDFTGLQPSRGIFLYPSDPPQIAATIEAAAALLRAREPGLWKSWRDFQVAGQIVFCSICKQLRHAAVVIADVTTLNFNLMFEIGFALGLDAPVVPIRDTSYTRDHHEFQELALLDTIGYVDFQNSQGLADSLLKRLPASPIPTPPSELKRQSPLYIVRGHINTEGELRLLSALQDAAIGFRSFDALETPRLSLHEARRQVAASLGVVGHLLSPQRRGALVHNARCALIAGIAVATGKSVLLLQEGEEEPQPIDYREIVKSYIVPEKVRSRVDPLLRQVIRRMQDVTVSAVRRPERLLERLDLGDVAAENEVRQLQSYFVRTAQYSEALRGHARLVIGRKGAGKTAIFYAVRDNFENRRSHLVVDLKPEGHQFTKLREVILSKLSPGLQEHTLTAFWNYILLSEMAQRIADYEHSWAHRDPERLRKFDRLVAEYRSQAPADSGDLSERLLHQVNRLTRRFETYIGDFASGVTEHLFQNEIRQLDDALAGYLAEKDEVWLLVDNLDKAWPTRGASDEDILILRALLEATRKLQRQLDKRGVACHSLVFIRNDIFEHLLMATSDKGKDTAISLDWDDLEVFKEIVRQRVNSTGLLKGDFDRIWPTVFDSHVGTRESFKYIMERTLLRPRDMLNFLHRAIELAINRGHERVLEDDIKAAEATYSEDILLALEFELRDVFPDVKDTLYVFLECPVEMPEAHVTTLLRNAGFSDDKKRSDALELLVWFGFLGVRSGMSTPVFAYQVRHNLAKVLTPVRRGDGTFVVHPAFRAGLGCVDRSAPKLL